MRHVMQSRKTRLVAGGASAAILAIVGTGAFAYYSDSSFEKNAKASTVPAISITDVDAPQNLVPGGPEKNIVVHLKNNSGDTQNVGQVNVKIRDDFSSQGNNTLLACTPADFEITQGPAAGALATGLEYDVTAKIKMLNRNHNQDNCKGVNIPLVVSFV